MLVNNNNNKHLKTAFITVLFLFFGSAYANHTPETGGDLHDKEIKAHERCGGIVKKGQGDGRAMLNGVQVEWIYVPTGSCFKISGSKPFPD